MSEDGRLIVAVAVAAIVVLLVLWVIVRLLFRKRGPRTP